MVGISVGQDRGLSEIGIIFDLFDQKICNIGSRYKAVSPTLGILKDLIAPGASTVCQNARTHDNPVEAAPSNNEFLSIFVVVSATEEKTKRDVLKEAKC